MYKHFYRERNFINLLTGLFTRIFNVFLLFIYLMLSNNFFLTNALNINIGLYNVRTIIMHC